MRLRTVVLTDRETINESDPTYRTEVILGSSCVFVRKSIVRARICYLHPMQHDVSVCLCIKVCACLYPPTQEVHEKWYDNGSARESDRWGDEKDHTGPCPRDTDGCPTLPTMTEEGGSERMTLFVGCR